MNINQIKLVSFKYPSHSLIDAILPYFRNFRNSLLTDYCKGYLHHSKTNGYFVASVAFYKGKILGWGIITSNYIKDDKNFESEYEEIFQNKRYLLMLFVKRSARKCKLGAKIVNELLCFSKKKVSVIAWNKSSHGFFQAMQKKFGEDLHIVDWT